MYMISQENLMIRPLTCPVCEKALPAEINGDSALFPFCSERCKQVDFHRWLSGAYAIVEEISPDALWSQLAEQADPGNE